jgi:deoxyribonuclease-4
MTALFGPAGNSDTYTNTVSKSSLQAPAWLRGIGLDAYEYQCGNGVHIGEASAKSLGLEASKNSIVMSIHAPYYISLSNPDFLDKNIGYVLQSCRALKNMGGRRVILHSGSVAGRSREDALTEASKMLEHILAAMDEAGYSDMTLCPETMGKINQLGDFDEVLTLCSVDERLIPCLDFGHLYARTLGWLEGYEKTAELFNRMENALGLERASRFHSHFSKIEYSKGGEKKHLNFSDDGFGPEFRPVARLAAERGYSPVFICESAGMQSEDSLEMKRIYLEEFCKCKKEGTYK